MFRRSADFYDLLYAGVGKDYDREAVEIDGLIQRHRPGAATLLDVACGTGAHLFRLKAGYRAAGLDVSPEMVAIARDRNPDLEIIEADMRAFDLGRTFDAVVCLFSSVGYMLTTTDLRRAVAAMARHVAESGVLMVEAWFEPEAWIEGHVATATARSADISIVRMNTSAREARVSIMDFHYLVGTADGVEHFTERHEMSLFTSSEYEAAFAAAGLEVERDGDALLGRGLYVARTATNGGI